MMAHVTKGVMVYIYINNQGRQCLVMVSITVVCVFLCKLEVNPCLHAYL